MPAPKRPNTTAATAAVVRRGHETMASKLRAAGYKVTPPGEHSVDLTDEELMVELHRRGKSPRCHCARWETYLSVYEPHGLTWCCRGCGRAIANCPCIL